MTDLTPEELNKQVDELEKQEEAAPGIVTETTSIKQEEAKTPEQVPKELTEEEYVNRAMSDYIGGVHHIELMLKKMSRRAVCRAFIAILKLPEEGQKVNFQSNEERVVFGIGQRVLNSRTTLLLNHMKNKIQEDKLKQEPTETTSDNKEIANGNN
jgi:hypothetical protein